MTLISHSSTLAVVSQRLTAVESPKWLVGRSMKCSSTVEQHAVKRIPLTVTVARVRLCRARIMERIMFDFGKILDLEFMISGYTRVGLYASIYGR